MPMRGLELGADVQDAGPLFSTSSEQLRLTLTGNRERFANSLPPNSRSGTRTRDPGIMSAVL